MTRNAPPRIVIVTTGGIAAYKCPELHRLLRLEGAETRSVMTAASKHFIGEATLEAASGFPVLSSLFSPQNDPSAISHVELGLWAELVIVAPATANFLAKMSLGLADDAAGTFMLATRAPVLVAPGMNDAMWEHPATRGHCEILRGRGVHFLGPETGALAEGYESIGRMSEPAQIAKVALELI